MFLQASKRQWASSSGKLRGGRGVALVTMHIVSWWHIFHQATGDHQCSPTELQEPLRSFLLRGALFNSSVLILVPPSPMDPLPVHKVSKVPDYAKSYHSWLGFGASHLLKLKESGALCGLKINKCIFGYHSITYL